MNLTSRHNLVPISQKLPVETRTIAAKEFHGVPLHALRCSQGVQVEVKNLIEGERFEGMIFSNEFPATFTVKGVALPSLGLGKVPTVNGKLSHSQVETIGTVSDRQFMVLVRGIITSVQNGLVNIVTEITQEPEESIVDAA